MEYHSANSREVWLTTNDIGPSYETNELGLGGSIISKALTKTSGITPAALKKLYNKHGDPGDVAFEAKVKQRVLIMKKPTPLSKCFTHRSGPGYTTIDP
jgi:DNA ligase-1